MIVADGLAKEFSDGTIAVEEVSFRVDPGEVLALLGPNGAGKTTTIHMLLGILPATRGRATIRGVDVHEDPREAYRHVGHLSENVLLYGNLSARENLVFFGRISGKTIPASRIEELLSIVDLQHAASRRVHTFSKGMRQRLGLAVALVKDPPALVLDEPTTGLDPDGTDALLALIRRLRDEGRAILLSTHDLHRVPQVADKIAVIGHKRVQAIVTPAEHPDIPALYRRLTG
jgi:ABC-2 type transport system ATP-binding protein